MGKLGGSLLPHHTSLALLCLSLPFFVHSQCTKNPVIFTFGDSNSDTGGYAFGLGFNLGLPNGRTFFHRSSGRISDGRLLIDFLCFKILNGYEDFTNALYIIDIGQNDLAGAFTYLSYAQILERIPTFITEIKYAIYGVWQRGGKNFWVHNTGPLGCLPQKLATRSKNASDFDQFGCLKPLNNGAKAFNEQLRALCEELRSELKNATIVYVDVFSIKYDLIANSTTYGFENPLMACCGYGGAPYNYNASVGCGRTGYNICEEGSKYISWDGVHYTEAANAIVASKILSTNYSTPPVKFDYFCNT
ncbi:hypothetical protein L1049_012580 [Liquidambar formosana]|uniref:Uncharacterized protein n=1 Tax=Liquidambar formosana TaxID=63359 RepID=A0AAP0N487_LIQFO